MNNIASRGISTSVYSDDFLDFGSRTIITFLFMVRGYSRISTANILSYWFCMRERGVHCDTTWDQDQKLKLQNGKAHGNTNTEIEGKSSESNSRSVYCSFLCAIFPEHGRAKYTCMRYLLPIHYIYKPTTSSITLSDNNHRYMNKEEKKIHTTKTYV